jgi:hypothetical protein
MTSRAAREHRSGHAPLAVLAVTFSLSLPAAAQAPPPLPPSPVEWLRASLQDPRWPEVCRSFLGSSPGVTDIARALGGLAAVPVQVDADLAMRAAGLLEASGSPEAALLFYVHAAASPGTPERRMNALLSSAALASDLGSGDVVLASIDKAIASSDGRERAELRALRALLRYDLGTRDLAVLDLRDVLPQLDAVGPLRLQVLFALAIHYHAAGDEPSSIAFKRQVRDSYPGSPEAAILASDKPVVLSAAPRHFLRHIAQPGAAAAPAAGPVTPPAAQPSPPAAGPPQAQPAPPDKPPVPLTAQPPQLFRIQAGSFTVAENASYMVKDLERAGFPSSVDKVVVGGRAYYRVTLSSEFTPDDARQALVKLKQAGFEGALIP